MTMQKTFPFAAITLVLGLFGCTNNFARFYQGPSDARQIPGYDLSYTPRSDSIPVYSSSDIKTDMLKLMSQGFFPIGESAFYGPDTQVSGAQLQQQGRSIGAHAILFYSSYRDTISGAVPLVVPNNSVSYTNETATAYGSGGYATGYGNSVTNTYGSTTVMMPFSQSRSNFDAVYFVKVHSRLGIYVQPLSDSERQELGTNLALRIIVVVQDSPAFLADILPGDYLLSINEEVTASQESANQLITKYQGQDVTIHLLRNGKKITKNVHLNSL